VNTPLSVSAPARFILAASALLLAAAGNSNAQLGKPTYITPAPAKSEPKPAPAPKPAKHSEGKDKAAAHDKPAKQNTELGVSGGTICHVDPDRCPDDPVPPQRKKVKP